MRKPVLLELAQMDAIDLMLDACKIRGVLMRREGEFLVLEEGNGRKDLAGVKQMCRQLNIPAFVHENRVQLLVTKLPISTAYKIIKFPGRNHFFHMEGYHKQWRHFANREFGVKTNTFDLDPNIALFMKALNKAGITALAGCDGHRRHAPNVRLSGPFTGAWMEIVQEQYLNHLQLHYKWSVQYDRHTGAILLAEKAVNELWDLSAVHHDTTTMAFVLLEKAAEIRNIKKVTYKRNKEMKQQATYFADEAMHQELKEWMKSLLDTKLICQR